MEYKPLRFFFTKEVEQDKCIVLGNGTSVLTYKDREDIFTIGVNDICKFFTPDVLMLVDTVARFKQKNIPNRLEDIRNSNPKYFLIKDPNWETPYSKTYQLTWGSSTGIPNLHSKNFVDTGLDSPYIAAQIAHKMGFKKVGLLGVDYTPNHFYQDDGEHDLVGKHNKLDSLNNLYKNLYEKLKEQETELFNLNPDSRITTAPFNNLENF